MPTLKKTAAKAAPYSFFLEAAGADELLRKPMFGAFAFYRDEKILFIVRERDSHPDDNGIWVVMEPKHHEAIRSLLPSLRSIRLFESGETTWQNLPSDGDAFEEEALALAELIVAGDDRIGKIPNQRKKLTKPKAPSSASKTSSKTTNNKARPSRFATKKTTAKKPARTRR